MGFGKDGKGVIFRQRDIITLGALAAKTQVKQDNVPAVTDSFRMIKSEGSVAIRSATLTEGDGPIELWLASDNLTILEIGEAMDSTAGQPLSREDRIGNEHAMRPIWYLGVLENAPTGIGAKVLFDWSKTIRWTFGDGESFVLIANNKGASALATGGILEFFHTAFGVWVGA